MKKFEKRTSDKYNRGNLTIESHDENKDYAYFADKENLYLSPQDFAELAIASVLDVAKRHPAEYRAAAIKAGVIEPRWVKKPGEEIKQGDFVKVVDGVRFVFEEGDILRVVRGDSDMFCTYLFFDDTDAGWLVDRFVKVVQE